MNIEQVYKDAHALLDGHFLLASGNHSSRYLQSAKVMESVHSGNTNPIQLPCELPYLTMFRVVAKDGEESCKVT